MAGKQEAAACPPATSLCLPDLVEGLHHLLVDDEHYGHVQTHSAQSRNCPFIETTGGHQEEKHIVSVEIVIMVYCNVIYGCDTWNEAIENRWFSVR